MRLIVLILAMIFSSLLYGQDVNFSSYKILHRKNTFVKKNFLHLNLKISSNEFKSSPDSLFRDRVLLNKKFKIEHTFPLYSERISSFEQNVDSLVVGLKSYCIEEQLRDRFNLFPEVKKIFIVKQKGGELLFVVGSHENDRCRNCEFWVLMFDISKDSPEIIKNEYGNEILGSDLDFIGDFNHDSLIDICLYSSNKIEVFNVVNGTLNIVNQYNIPLYQDANGYFYIKRAESHWFYDIKYLGNKQYINCNKFDKINYHR